MELLCHQSATSLTLDNYFPVKYVAVYMDIRTMCPSEEFRFIESLPETHSANAYFGESQKIKLSAKKRIYGKK